MLRSALLVLLPSAALALTGCFGGGDERDADAPVRGGTVIVYSSLPFSGVSRSRAEAVAAGERLALADARHRVGRLRVRLVQLDAAKPGGRTWDPATVEDNAEEATKDPLTIAYVGELDFGASAVSVPVTNGRDILQVAPTDGLTSLTRTPPGRPRSGPDRLYPNRRRNFLRLVPDDLEVAEALTARAAAAGRRLAIVTDESLYGSELAAQVAARAPRAGMTVVDGEDLRADDVSGAPDAARKVAQHEPDAVVFAGIAGPATPVLMDSLARALPTAELLGGDGLLVGPPPAVPRVTAVSGVGPASAYPPAGRRLLRRLGPEGAPQALYGYEAIEIVLDALRAKGPRRRAVAVAALVPRARSGPLGRYRVVAGGGVAGPRPAAFVARAGAWAPLIATAR